MLVSAARVSLSGVALRWRVCIYRRGGGCQEGPAVSAHGVCEKKALVGSNGFITVLL